MSPAVPAEKPAEGPSVDDDARTLANPKALPHLAHLDITGSDLGDAATAALRDRFGTGLVGP